MLSNPKVNLAFSDRISWRLFQYQTAIEFPSFQLTSTISFRPDVLRAVTLQRDRLDMARCFDAKAKESSDLLLMAIYTLMPPARALEIRTLKVVASSSTDSVKKGQNTVCVDDKGFVKFRFEDYKTVTTYGADETILEVRY